MSQFSKFRLGSIFSLIFTAFPLLGLIRQFVDPTGDKQVIIILGTIITIFFFISIFLLYTSMSEGRVTKNRRISRYLAWLLLVYPFLGILPSILILQATKNENR